MDSDYIMSKLSGNRKMKASPMQGSKKKKRKGEKSKKVRRKVYNVILDYQFRL